MEITRVGVIGSGIMGAGIAQVAAQAGYEVVLRSRQQATADATLASLEKGLNRLVEKGRMEEADRDATLGRITATSVLKDLADCDLVIESVVEDLATKKALFVELNQVCRDDAILATNTSTLAVIEMAVEVHNPSRVCGIHFFNPAPAMNLVEVIRPLTAADETVAAAKAFAEACGKAPVEVKDQAGFIVNALLFPYLNNAVRLLENGTASRHEGRLQLPDGAPRVAGSGRPRHLGVDPGRPLRRVPGPALRRRSPPAAHGRRRSARPQDRTGLLRVLPLTRRPGRTRMCRSSPRRPPGRCRPR
jgi:3-hydroxybutyryl-CoA dehydrogenase